MALFLHSIRSDFPIQHHLDIIRVLVFYQLYSLRLLPGAVRLDAQHSFLSRCCCFCFHSPRLRPRRSSRLALLVPPPSSSAFNVKQVVIPSLPHLQWYPMALSIGSRADPQEVGFAALHCAARTNCITIKTSSSIMLLGVFFSLSLSLSLCGNYSSPKGRRLDFPLLLTAAAVQSATPPHCIQVSSRVAQRISTILMSFAFNSVEDSVPVFNIFALSLIRISSRAHVHTTHKGPEEGYQEEKKGKERRRKKRLFSLR